MGVLGEHRAGEPGAWETQGPEKLRSGIPGPGGTSWGLEAGTPESGRTRASSQQWHLLPESPGVGSETNASSSWIPRARQDSGDLPPTSSPVLTSSGCGNREMT